ncbi:MAG: hypothetical protein EOP86_22330 [Verrucomicrobiaceae bacterium]|nr:MAG: hypothetical protein EOP86_22330 [Verrucomicrobiaceae bacterium]
MGAGAGAAGADGDAGDAGDAGDPAASGGAEAGPEGAKAPGLVANAVEDLAAKAAEVPAMRL